MALVSSCHAIRLETVLIPYDQGRTMQSMLWCSVVAQQGETLASRDKTGRLLSGLFRCAPLGRFLVNMDMIQLQYYLYHFYKYH